MNEVNELFIGNQSYELISLSFAEFNKALMQKLRLHNVTFFNSDSAGYFKETLFDVPHTLFCALAYLIYF